MIPLKWSLNRLMKLVPPGVVTQNGLLPLAFIERIVKVGGGRGNSFPVSARPASAATSATKHPH